MNCENLHATQYSGADLVKDKKEFRILSIGTLACRKKHLQKSLESFSPKF